MVYYGQVTLHFFTEYVFNYTPICLLVLQFPLFLRFYLIIFLYSYFFILRILNKVEVNNVCEEFGN